MRLSPCAYVCDDRPGVLTPIERTGSRLRGSASLGAILLLFTIIALALAPRLAAHAAASDVRVIMVEEEGCRFCKKWHAEIGPAYAKSPEGHFAPLKRVTRAAPEIRGFTPIVYTPTFIVVRSGEEVGRITGYPGKTYFWIELAPLLASVGFIPPLN